MQNVFYCWPYEELQVKKLDENRAFLFETPWHSSIVRTSEEGAAFIETVFCGDATQIPPSQLLEYYSTALSGMLHEPFAYILAQSPTAADGATSTFAPNAAFATPQSWAQHYGLPPQAFNWDWTWDADAILALAKMDHGDFYSPVSLYSIFRRSHYLEAQSRDRTRSLYQSLPEVCTSSEKMKNALGYMITQNLHVTKRASETLGAALPLARAAEERLRDFVQAEYGHDGVMSQALAAFPGAPLEGWAHGVHPQTRLLMDTFLRLAQNHFFAFAFSIHLFERPHAGDNHPLTDLLREAGFNEAADRYERHHQINEAGDHGQVAFDMIKDIPPLTRAAAEQAVRWIEAMSFVMTAHSGALLQEIEAHVA